MSRPNYDHDLGTHAYVTKFEAYWGTDWSHPTNPMKVEGDSRTDPLNSCTEKIKTLVHDQLTQKDHDSSKNQWVRSSNPKYDHPSQRENDSSKIRWGRSSNPEYDQPPQRDHSGSENQWGTFPTKSRTRQEFGVPKNHVLGNYRVPKNQWDKPLSPDYGELVTTLASNLQ